MTHSTRPRDHALETLRKDASCIVSILDFGWLGRCFGPKPSEMIEERLHYENLKSFTDKQLDVVRYLYMRLNIIDAKVGYLLRINTLTAGILGIIISLSLRDGVDLSSKLPSYGLALLLVALGLMFLAFLICYAMGGLRYDHITEPSDLINHIDIETYCLDVDAHHGSTRPSHKDRRFMGTYSIDHIRTIIAARDQAPAEKRSLKDYEDLFFEITIQRQKMLRAARACVLLAYLCYVMFFVVLIFKIA